jgi:hypothetical protein
MVELVYLTLFILLSGAPNTQSAYQTPKFCFLVEHVAAYATSFYKRNWLKLFKLQEKDINEENIYFLLAAHAAESKHHVKWEEVKILGKENQYKRIIHEAAAMHKANNVISQPSYEIPPLWHSILREERKPRRKEKQRNKKMARKRGREEEEEASSRRKLRRTEITVVVVDRRHRHKTQLRRK